MTPRTAERSSRQSGATGIGGIVVSRPLEEEAEATVARSRKQAYANRTDS
jgi:hypothetical protein